MSLNPKIRKDANGVWWLDWTSDPQAIAYDVIISSGAHVQAGKKAVTMKLGATKPNPLPQIAPARPGAYETAVDPTTPPPQPTPAVFVSPTGNDTTGDGSELKPFKTLVRARTAMRAGGPQICYVRGGTYPVASSETLVNFRGVTVSYGLRLIDQDSGQTWSYFPPDGYNSAVLDGGSTSASTGIHVLIAIDGAANVTVDGLDVQHFRWVGVGVHGRLFYYDIFPATVPEARGVTVRNCKIHDGAYDTSPIYGYGGASLFAGRSTPDLTIDHNVIWNVPTGGISLQPGPPGGYISGDSKYLEGLRVTANAVFSTCQSITDAGGIYIQDQKGDSTMTVASNFIRDVGGGRWIYLDDGTSNADVTGNVMAGLGDIACTVHGGENVKWRGNLIDAAHTSTNGPLGLLFQDSTIKTDHLGVEFTNNILITKAKLLHKLVFPVLIRDNLYFAYSPAVKASIATAPDTNPVYADPKLSGPLYTLDPASPAYAAPVSFVPLTQGYGPPGYVIPAGTAPSYS